MKLGKILHFTNYARFVRNWYDILLLRSGLRNRAKIVLRGKPDCPLFIDRRAYATLSGLIYLISRGARYDPCNDILEIPYAGKRLLFSDIMKNKYYSFIVNDLLEVYFFEEYSFLDVRDKSVVDVGASIGDSAIYFAVRGAKQVKAYEPVPHICELMKRNVELNRLDSIISVECSAVVGNMQEGEITICVEEHGYGFTPGSQPISEKCRGRLVQVPATVIPRSDVLKMDCEGCEYSIISSMSEPLFDEIGMEYHDHPSMLVKRLRELGYSVRIVKKKPAKGGYREIGIMHAVLKR